MAALPPLRACGALSGLAAAKIMKRIWLVKRSAPGKVMFFDRMQGAFALTRRRSERAHFLKINALFVCFPVDRR